MAIIGLTDKGASFPQIGTLRKGAAKPNEKRPGADLTYFRLDTTDPAVEAAFRAAYGPEPSDINCFLPFDTVEENFFTAKEEWAGGGLVRRCDGQTCSIHLTSDGTYDREPSLCLGEGCQCKPTGRLKIIVPELRRLAYLVVTTTSIHDIMTLHQNLTAYEMAASGLRGIPFILKRRPRMVSTPGQGGKRVRREKWLLSIEAAPVWVNAHIAMAQREALPGGNYAELEAPFDEDEGPLVLGPGVDSTTEGDKPETTEMTGNGKLEAFLMQVKLEVGLEAKETTTILKSHGITGFNPDKEDDYLDLLEAQKAVPTTEAALLVIVNRETGGYFKHENHLRNGIGKALGETFEPWPPQTTEGWKAAKQLGIEYGTAPKQGE